MNLFNYHVHSIFSNYYHSSQFDKTVILRKSKYFRYQYNLDNNSNIFIKHKQLENVRNFLITLKLLDIKFKSKLFVFKYKQSFFYTIKIFDENKINNTDSFEITLLFNNKYNLIASNFIINNDKISKSYFKLGNLGFNYLNEFIEFFN